MSRVQGLCRSTPTERSRFLEQDFTDQHKQEDGGRPGENPSHDTRGLGRLSDLGISYDQSSRWQMLAAMPEDASLLG